MKKINLIFLIILILLIFIFASLVFLDIREYPIHAKVTSFDNFIRYQPVADKKARLWTDNAFLGALQLSLYFDSQAKSATIGYVYQSGEQPNKEYIVTLNPANGRLISAKTELADRSFQPLNLTLSLKPSKIYDIAESHGGYVYRQSNSKSNELLLALAYNTDKNLTWACLYVPGSGRYLTKKDYGILINAKSGAVITSGNTG